MRPEMDCKPTLEGYVLSEIMENLLAKHRLIKRS